MRTFFQLNMTILASFSLSASLRNSAESDARGPVACSCINAAEKIGGKLRAVLLLGAVEGSTIRRLVLAVFVARVAASECDGDSVVMMEWGVGGWSGDALKALLSDGVMGCAAGEVGVDESEIVRQDGGRGAPQADRDIPRGAI